MFAAEYACLCPLPFGHETGGDVAAADVFGERGGHGLRESGEEGIRGGNAIHEVRLPEKMPGL